MCMSGAVCLSVCRCARVSNYTPSLPAMIILAKLSPWVVCLTHDISPITKEWYYVPMPTTGYQADVWEVMPMLFACVTHQKFETHPLWFCVRVSVCVCLIMPNPYQAAPANYCWAKLRSLRTKLCELRGFFYNLTEWYLCLSQDIGQMFQRLCRLFFVCITHQQLAVGNSVWVCRCS